MREIVKLSIAEPKDHRAHGCVSSRAHIVAIGFESGAEIIHTLLGDTWHLLISKQICPMARFAALHRCQFAATRNFGRIRRLARQGRRQASVMGRNCDDLRILKPLHDLAHRVDLAHAFAQQDELIENEKIGLSGQRGNALKGRIARLSMTGRALCKPVVQRLRMN